MITPKVEFCENPVSDSRDVTCEQTDGEFIGAFLGPSAKSRKATIKLRHVCAPVSSSAWNNSVPTERIFMKFDICLVFENML